MSRRKPNAAPPASPRGVVAQHYSAGAFLLLGLFAFILYGNSIHNQFVFDDIPLIVENPLIKDLKNIPAIIGWENGLPLYRPVRYLSYTIDYAISGLKPAGYHVANILYHAITAWVIFLLLVRLMKNRLTAMIGAVLFVAHPVVTDSVTYLSGRRDILVTLFYLCAFYQFVRYREQPQLWRLMLVPLFFILALGAKEMAVTFPLVCLLYDFTRSWTQQASVTGSTRKHIGAALTDMMKRGWKIYLPCGVLALFFIYYKIILYYPSQRIIYYGGSATSNFSTVIRIVCHYLKQALFPVVLHADYSYNAFPLSYSFFEPRVIGAAVVIGMLLWLVARALTRQPWIFFGGLWFFITLLPVCQIFPHHELLAEHYLYLPLVGVLVVATPLWEYMFARQRRAATALLAVLVLLFSVRTIDRNRDWKDGMSLWTSVLKNAPQSARAHNNLGTEYLNRKDYQTALGHYQQAVRLRPEHAIFHNNLGRVYGVLGDLENAQAELVHATKLDPTLAEAMNNLGIIYFQKKQYEAAAWLFAKSERLKPDARVAFNLAKAQLQLGLSDNALTSLQTALQLQPDYPDALLMLGVQLRKQGNNDGALKAFSRLVSIKPQDAEAHCNIGAIYYDRRDYAPAAAALEKGLAVNPKIPKAYFLLAESYVKMGNLARAADTYERACAHNSQDAGVLYRAALLYGRTMHNREKSLAYLDKASRLTGDASLKEKIAKEIQALKGT
jgi:tetratricopeptide (TPR) repeat protein